MMKRCVTLLWMLLLAVWLTPVLAESEAGGGQIYRTLDADGNVVFTDNPTADQAAEPVRLSPANAYSAPRVRLPAASLTEQPQAGKGYQSLTIVSPEPGSTLRNVFESLPVKAGLSPSLAEGHRLVLFDNGVAQPGLLLDTPNPGVHVLQLKVLDEGGNVLISSEPAEVYVHRTTVNSRQSRPPSQGPGARPGNTARPGGAAERSGSTARPSSGSARPGGAASRAAPASPAGSAR